MTNLVEVRVLLPPRAKSAEGAQVSDLGAFFVLNRWPEPGTTRASTVPPGGSSDRSLSMQWGWGWGQADGWVCQKDRTRMAGSPTSMRRPLTNAAQSLRPPTSSAEIDEAFAVWSTTGSAL